jgi:hypothetical protein
MAAQGIEMDCISGISPQEECRYSHYTEFSLAIRCAVVKHIRTSGYRSSEIRSHTQHAHWDNHLVDLHR